MNTEQFAEKVVAIWRALSHVEKLKALAPIVQECLSDHDFGVIMGHLSTREKLAYLQFAKARCELRKLCAAMAEV